MLLPKEKDFELVGEVEKKFGQSLVLVSGFNNEWLW